MFRSRRTTPPTAQGRWSLLPVRPQRKPAAANTWAPLPSCRKGGKRHRGLAPAETPTATEPSHALALQLLSRYGVLLREHVAAENIPGGFHAVYDVLKALEESGRIRRGYFVAGLGATQFALPAAVDLLRQLRTAPPDEKPEFVQLAATDPANPYGSVLRWPDLPVAEEDAETAPRVLTRAAYAEVILRNGQLVAWLRRGNPNILVFLPPEEPERSQAASGLAHFLCSRGQERMRPAATRACSSPPSTANSWRRIPWAASSWTPASIPARWACTCAAFPCPSTTAGTCVARCSNSCPKAIPSSAPRAHSAARSSANRSRFFAPTYPLLTRFNDDTPLAGQQVERVEPRGKWLLIHFSGGGTLATHMLMSGSWHIYRHGERWQQPRANMRIVLENSDYIAVGFRVPVAKMMNSRDVERTLRIPQPGIDVLSEHFDAAQVALRIAAHGAEEIGDVLLHQEVIAGVGNVFKSEICFDTGSNPFCKVQALSQETIAELIAASRRLVKANVLEDSAT